MPVTITRPLAAEIVLTASENAGAESASAVRIASSSASRPLRSLAKGAERRPDGAGLLLDHEPVLYHSLAGMETPRLLWAPRSAALAREVTCSRRQFLFQPRSKVAAVERERDVGCEEPEPGAAASGLPVEPYAMEGLGACELDHAVGELNFTARALFDQIPGSQNLRLGRM